MNQHITKLVRQALKECVSTPVESVVASRIDDHGIVEIPNTFAEKFAQLIVKECIELADDEASRFYNMDEYELASVMENFREKLKEHFGIKE